MLRYTIFLFFLALGITNCRLIKVINVFSPGYPPPNYGDETVNSAPGLIQPGIEQQFKLGVSLFEAYGKELGITKQPFNNSIYFTPEDAVTVASATAQLAGFADTQLDINLDGIESAVNDAELLRESVVNMPGYSFMTLDIDHLPNMHETLNFRILPQSLLLEATEFDCTFRNNYVNQKKNTVPKDLHELYDYLSKVLSDPENSIKLQPEDLFKLYRQLEIVKELDQLPESMGDETFANLQYLVSVYVLYTYHDDPILKRMDAGSLLRALFHEMQSETGYKVVNFGVHHTSFTALLSIFDIINWRKIVEKDSIGGSSSIKELLYPKYGSNLVIEVHLENSRLMMSVKYNGVGHSVCKSGELKCGIKETQSSYSSYFIRSPEGFQKLCKGQMADIATPTSVERKFTTDDFLYYAGLIILIYIGYRICRKIIGLMQILQHHRAQKREQAAESSGIDTSRNESQLELNEIDQI